MPRPNSTENSYDLLTAISQAQSEFILNGETRVLFDRLLQRLLDLTQSEYGFIGEVLYTSEGAPYLKTHALTNIAWNEATRTFYKENGDCSESTGLPPEDVYRKVRVRTFAPGGQHDVRSR